MFAEHDTVLFKNRYYTVEKRIYRRATPNTKGGLWYGLKYDEHSIMTFAHESEVTAPETTLYASGGWCGIAHHKPQLVKG